MLPKKNLSHINSLQDLRIAKTAALKEIEESGAKLEESFSGFPLRALGGAVGFATGLFSGRNKVNQQKNDAYAQNPEEAGDSSIKTVLQELALQLAIMGVTKMVSKIFSKTR